MGQVDTDNLFDLKVQLANEYLRNGGMDSIKDIQLLDDLINYNHNNEKTHTSRLKAFLNLVLEINMSHPIVYSESQSEYISFTQKELFFDQIKIDREDQIDELFDKFLDSDDYLFRGQREASWRLYSKMQRFWTERKYENVLDYETVLNKMIKSGKEENEEIIKQVTGKDHIDVTNDLAVLGFLQHHGCATPLLDWTSSFKNALFFAFDGITQNTVVKEIGDYASLYYLEKEYIVSGGMGSILDETISTVGKQLTSAIISVIAKDEATNKEMTQRFGDRSFIDRSRLEGAGLISSVCSVRNMMDIPSNWIYYGENDEYEGVIFSLLNSENIKTQKGAFTFNNNPYKPLEQVALENHLTQQEEENDNTKGEEQDFTEYKICHCYNINKKLKPYIEKKLNDLGVVKETIYPDEEIDTTPIFGSAIAYCNRLKMYQSIFSIN